MTKVLVSGRRFERPKSLSDMNCAEGPLMTFVARRAVIAAAMVMLGLAGCSNTEGPVAASTSAGTERAALVQSSEAALQALYSTQPGARKLAEDARAVLVFPSITKA